MKVITGGRQSGRTTQLIHMCAEAEKEGKIAYIVCHSHDAAYAIAQRAKELGYESFPFPITYDEFKNSHGKSTFITEYYIDNVEFLLQWLSVIPIKAVTIQTEE